MLSLIAHEQDIHALKHRISLLHYEYEYDIHMNAYVVLRSTSGGLMTYCKRQLANDL